MYALKRIFGLSLVIYALLVGIFLFALSQHKVVKAGMITPDLPPFVVRIEPGLGIRAGNNLCIEISLHPLAERGVFADELNEQVRETTALQVDGVRLPEDEYNSGFQWLTLMSKIEDGEVVGSYGGEITFCYRFDQLSIGQHTATFSVQNVSGTEFTYAWQFELISLLQAGV